MRAAVKRPRDRAITLHAGSIPNLEIESSVLDLDEELTEITADSRLKVLGELLQNESSEDGRFAHRCFSNHYHLEESIVALILRYHGHFVHIGICFGPCTAILNHFL